jgi:general stress protein 26
MLVTRHTLIRIIWTAVTAVDFHLAEAIQQQVEVRVCVETKKKKSSFVEL